MKLDIKKMRLVAVSFLCGFLFCAVLFSRSSTQQSTPRVVASGPLLATTQFQPQPAPILWIAPQRTSPGIIRIEPDPIAEQMQLLPGGRSAHSVDLIDTRHQPSVDLRDIQ